MTRKKQASEAIGEFQVCHCQHPTALWPWYITDSEGRMILSPNGLGFQTKRLAKAACELVSDGKLEVVPRVCLVGRYRKNGLKFDDSRFVVMMPGHGAKLDGRPVPESVEMLRKRSEGAR